MMLAGIIVRAVGVLFLVIGVISWLRIRRFLSGPERRGVLRCI